MQNSERATEIWVPENLQSKQLQTEKVAAEHHATQRGIRASPHRSFVRVFITFWHSLPTRRDSRGTRSDCGSYWLRSSGGSVVREKSPGWWIEVFFWVWRFSIGFFLGDWRCWLVLEGAQFLWVGRDLGRGLEVSAGCDHVGT